MTTRPEDVEAAKAHFLERMPMRVGRDPWVSVDIKHARTLLTSHATLSADLATAENVLVSQSALVRSQAERIASLEAASRPDKPTLMRIISAFTACTADDGVVCREACHCSRLADAIISGRDPA